MSNDAAFLEELQTSDPQRFARLVKVDPEARALVADTRGIRVGTCARCKGPIGQRPIPRAG